MSELVIEQVRKYVDLLLPSMGLELVEVQFRQEGHGWVLRVFVDSPDGVKLDDCSKVSRELSDYLDVEDLIEQAFHLEVSSPGLERTLYNMKDFRRFVGRKARLKLHAVVDGQKVFVGKILAAEDDTVDLVAEDGKEYHFAFAEISKARLSL
ncbi:MAG: ribosome maturation factor RimP [Desulfobulbaceae bacterium]|uniref:Ribosome maturation factor RimP n=1 Tax=Candidatus Desulfatifera sulfidica TaxID=2841691 RepID=A0A8J6TCM9_9BACT|nr:ribosome maturation factor RimP [Candidatus Desulfatifera sulfidica]